jgi:hypothetical protein
MRFQQHRLAPGAGVLRGYITALPPLLEQLLGESGRHSKPSTDLLLASLLSVVGGKDLFT